ncbi:4561_t:CDS:2 [Entrophospora sp. SA101]|nr:4561_t:CDS:2 [Entrophospora sp. SA101]
MSSEKTSVLALKCARLKLRPNNVPDELPGRESEYKRIYGKVRSAIEQFSGCCICVSGQAGTGKTATVECVMDNLKKEVSEVSEMSFHLVKINGMELNSPEELYTILWKQLTGVIVNSSDAKKLLDARFKAKSEPGHRNQSSLVSERRSSDYKNRSSSVNKRRPLYSPSLVEKRSRFYHRNQKDLPLFTKDKVNKRIYFGDRSSLVNKKHFDRRDQLSLAKERRHLYRRKQSTLVKERRHFRGRSSLVKEGRLSDYGNQSTLEHKNQSSLVSERRPSDYEDRSSLVNKRIHLDHSRCFSSKPFIELIHEFAAKTHVMKPRYQIFEIKDTDKLDKFYSKMFLNG